MQTTVGDTTTACHHECLECGHSGANVWHTTVKYDIVEVSHFKGAWCRLFHSLRNSTQPMQLGLCFGT